MYQFIVDLLITVFIVIMSMLSGIAIATDHWTKCQKCGHRQLMTICPDCEYEHTQGEQYKEL